MNHLDRRSWLRLKTLAALSVAVPLRGATTLIRGPYLQNVQADRASILWTATQTAVGKVTLTDGATTRTNEANVRLFTPAETQLPDSFYQFQVDFAALRPATRYTYRVHLDGQQIFESSFLTAGPGRFSFLALGDSGSGSSQQTQLQRLLAAEPDVAFLLHTGDIAYELGTFAQFDARHFAGYSALMARLPFFTTPGNHEYYTGYAAPYLAVHSFPDSGTPTEDRGRYYSFDWGPAHIVSLDTNLHFSAEFDRMINWLELDLQRTNKFWKLALFHHTPYPTGYHRDDPLCTRAREVIVPILERYGVQLALNGHEHSYQRTLLEDKATVYINTSGGGAWLQPITPVPTNAVTLSEFHYLRLDVNGGSLSIRAINLNGGDIDRFVLSPQPSLTAVVNSADYSPALAEGSLITIFGHNLAFDTSTRVALNSTLLNLLYTSPTQINAQLPFGVIGSCSLIIATPNGSANITLTIAPVAPAIFELTRSAKPLTATDAVTPGTTISILATGLGALNTPVRILIGDLALTPTRAVMVTGISGLYEVAFAIPNLPGGSYPLLLELAGVRSQPVPLRIVPTIS